MSTALRSSASSPQLMRQANRQAVLRYALGGACFTAADAMEATGLTRATVLGICSDLSAAGWLAEPAGSGQGAPAGRGRPARRYSLRTDTAVLVGIDAGEHTLTVRVADLLGRDLATLSETICECGAEPAGRDRIAAVTALIDRALAEAGAAETIRVLTVIGVPAPVDENGASPVDENGFWSRMNPDFATALRAGREGLDKHSVLVENDANLAAIADHAGGAGDHMATLLMGERLGAGIIVDGHLLRGMHGGAGEMRFLDVVLNDPRGADGVAVLARRWALDELSCHPAPDQQSPLARIPEGELRAQHVFAAAEDGDAVALRVLDRIAERLAMIASVQSSLLGVHTVLVAGAVAEAIGPVLDRARRMLPRISTPPHPKLVASRHGSDIVVSGAIELALARVRDDPLRHLSVL